MAAKLNATCPSLIHRELDSVKAAFLYLLHHLFFHYLIENATSIVEMISGNQYVYTKYILDIYSEVFNSSSCLEEALTNRYLLEKSDECHIDNPYLTNEILMQGNGYHDILYYAGHNFKLGIRRLISQIEGGSINPFSDKPLDTHSHRVSRLCLILPRRLGMRGNLTQVQVIDV
jgi:hypothetical protein